MGDVAIIFGGCCRFGGVLVATGDAAVVTVGGMIAGAYFGSCARRSSCKRKNNIFTFVLFAPFLLHCISNTME